MSQYPKERQDARHHPYDPYYEQQPKRQVEAQKFDESVMDPELLEHPYGPHVAQKHQHPHSPVDDKPEHLLFPPHRPTVQDSPPPSPEAADRDPRRKGPRKHQ